MVEENILIKGFFKEWLFKYVNVVMQYIYKDQVIWRYNKFNK